ncbi:hypothetical protein S83_063806 [Arachis hypogaea]
MSLGVNPSVVVSCRESGDCRRRSYSFGASPEITTRSLLFTALISWSRGASIGCHSDDNKSYLKQRHFVVVCYLNNYGKDFNGGLLHFQDGQPMSIMPMAGDVLMYTVDQRNIHSVDEVYSIVLLSCMPLLTWPCT